MWFKPAVLIEPDRYDGRWSRHDDGGFEARFQIRIRIRRAQKNVYDEKRVKPSVCHFQNQNVNCPAQNESNRSLE